MKLRANVLENYSDPNLRHGLESITSSFRSQRCHLSEWDQVSCLRSHHHLKMGTLQNASPGLSSLPSRLLDARAGHLALHRALHIVRDESPGRETLPRLALGAWSHTPSTESARLPHRHAPASAQRSWPLRARREDSKAVLYFLTSLPASIKILQYRFVKPRGFRAHSSLPAAGKEAIIGVICCPQATASGKSGGHGCPGPLPGADGWEKGAGGSGPVTVLCAAHQPDAHLRGRLRTHGCQTVA